MEMKQAKDYVHFVNLHDGCNAERHYDPTTGKWFLVMIEDTRGSEIANTAQEVKAWLGY